MSQKGQILAGDYLTNYKQDDEVAAWQEVEEGRFMPQRVRGSCQGRALG